MPPKIVIGLRILQGSNTGNQLPNQLKNVARYGRSVANKEISEMVYRELSGLVAERKGVASLVLLIDHLKRMTIKILIIKERIFINREAGEAWRWLSCHRRIFRFHMPRSTTEIAVGYF